MSKVPKSQQSKPRAKPVGPTDQGFDGIGWASRIFFRYYAEQTTGGDQVIQLDGAAAPEWFAPLADWDFKKSKLPLWLMRPQAAEQPLPHDTNGLT